MRELIKICPKIQFSLTFLVLFEHGGSALGQKRCGGDCPNFSETN